MSDGEMLDRVQQQVADRKAVDWHALEAELLSGDDLAALKLLQLLDEIAHVHTAFQTGDEQGAGMVFGHEPWLPDDNQVPQSWGRYRLDERVGRGGFGSVYRAWDPVLEMPVAIKILHERVGDDELKERLLREGRALAQVKHPNVVQVLNVEQNEGHIGLVMEYLRGQTLDAMVADRGMLNAGDLMVIGEDVCRALVAVHTNRLLHRDVKARNIIRERDGRIVLMDFGAGMSEEARSDDRGVVGTPFYMAPEMLRGQPASIATDIYAVGVLLFFLATRRYPVEASSVDDLRRAHATRERRSLLELRPDLPSSFVRIVERALAPEAQDRFLSAQSLQQALAYLRSSASGWQKWLVRGAIIVTSVAVMMTLGGMLSTAAFNLTLGRSEYSTESLSDWFELGRRSLVLPIVLALLGIGGIGVAAAARSLLATSSSRVRALDRLLVQRYDLLAQRLSLTDLGVCSCWLVLLTAFGAIAVAIYWAPLIQAIASSVATAPHQTLEILSPAHEKYQTNFRLTLSMLAAGNVAAWYGLVRSAAARGTCLPPWLRWGEIATLVLLYGTMQIPYRFIHDTNKFFVVQWSNERCYLLGERFEDTLLFCPRMTPRHRIVPRSAASIAASDVREHLFATFAAPTR